MKKTTDHSLGVGVYFAANDCAGYVRRTFAVAVDLAVLIFWGGLLWFAILYLAPASMMGGEYSDPSGIFLPLMLASIWGYLTVLKRSRLRTLGYCATGLRIVDLRGERPSLLRMTFRMFCWMLKPNQLLFDLMWLGIDPQRQPLRDCYAGTIVAKINSEPVGKAPIHTAIFFAGGCVLMYPRVARPPGAEDTLPG